MTKRFPAILFLLHSMLLAGQPDFYSRLADSALSLTRQKVIYDPAYYSIDYPGGDVPADRGVCSDVVIRAYRKLGIDLQVRIHEDMSAHFNEYPDRWGLSGPDPNIDHRRVPNLMKYFSRVGQEKSISGNPEDYLPGDLVCWDLGGGIAHIGIVSALRSDDGERPLIVHNIGAGQELADCLFSYTIIGHYRYGGQSWERTEQSIAIVRSIY
jgi:uncharacterized protein YijF (DUF1287 family)